MCCVERERASSVRLFFFIIILYPVPVGIYAVLMEVYVYTVCVPECRLLLAAAAASQPYLCEASTEGSSSCLTSSAL